MSSQQKARLTTDFSLILGAVSFAGGIIGVIARFPACLITGLFILTVTLSIACAFGRSENILIRSTLLVGGLILGGFFIGVSFPELIAIILILLLEIVPGLTLSIYRKLC